MIASWHRRRKNAISSRPKVCCRTRSPPMCGRRFAIGESQKDCPKIRSRPFAKADTWSVSLLNARQKMLRALRPMPSRGPKKYLAFDIGAESGRAVLARVTAETIAIEEVRRFPNQPLQEAGSLRWDVKRLWDDIRKVLANMDCELQGVGVDTWGVDYALLDKSGELVEYPYHYRDSRTRGIPEEVFGAVSKEEIYSTTGIQFMPINTLYQLFAQKKRSPEVLSRAKRMVMIPDLFHYWMTGNAVCEFTNASTTQMVNAVTRTWDSGLLERVGLPSSLPAPIVEPGTVVGKLLPELGMEKMSDTPVIAPATHDTGSAVAAIAAREGTAFISSGTWSLVGMEVDAP